jgi:hypothetical protein
MKWAGNVARKEERRGVAGFLYGNLRVRRRLEGICLDGKIILKWIFNKARWMVWIGLTWLRIGTVAGSCEHGNKFLVT